MAGHGSRPLRGLESTGQSSIQTGKFGRMFRWLEPAVSPRGAAEEKEVQDLMQGLAKLMVTTEFVANLTKGDPTPDSPITKAEPDDENPTIPAGYTYLGQFIDHDITFDPASSLQKQNDPDALEDFRTPRLDLDSVYGRGPADQPYLYAKREKDNFAKPDRVKFILGDNRGVEGMDRPDLQRTKDNTALIGDKRNDENKIVSQIQALFQKFHNKVYDQLDDRFTADQAEEHFLETQRIVRWCYQWIVLHDYLPKICGSKLVTSILPITSKDFREPPRFQFYLPHGGDAFMPVEFSVAAFRFGHSMVRPSYSLNNTILSGTAKFDFNGTPVPFARIPVLVARSNRATDSMNGFGEPLPGSWGIDWKFFFGTLGQAKEGDKQIPQPSYRIDASLVDPLGDLPEFVSAGMMSPFTSLAFRNLLRGVSMGLPSGQRVAHMMGTKHVLTDDELWARKNEGEKIEEWPEGKAFFDANSKWLKGAAPLWYYILKEAEIRHHGHHLGDVGGRIVAETLIGLVWHDHYSYLFQIPRWTPFQEDVGLSAKLDMLELTTFAG